MKAGVALGASALIAGCSLITGESGHGEESPSALPVVALGPEEWRDAVVDDFQPVALPDTYLPDIQVSFDPSGVSPTKDFPGLMVAETFQAKELPQLGIWVIAADGTIDGPGTIGESDYVVRPMVATDDVTTAIVARSYDATDGWRLLVATSADRDNWDVSYHPKLGKLTPTALAVTEDRIVLVGVEGGQLSGAVIAGNSIKRFEVPEAEDPEGESVRGLAISGEQIVILRNLLRPGAPSENVVDVADSADDAFQTLNLPNLGWASQLIRIPGGYFVAGSESASTEWVASGWTSVDGKTWTPEPVPSAGEIPGDSTSTTLAAVTSSGGRTVGFVSDDLSSNGAAFERAEDGSWTMLAAAPEGLRLFHGGIPLPRPDGGVTLVMNGLNRVVFDQIVPGTGWVLSEEKRDVTVMAPTFAVEMGGVPAVFATGSEASARGKWEGRGELLELSVGKLTVSEGAIPRGWKGGLTGLISMATDSKNGATLMAARGSDGVVAWVSTESGDWKESVVVDGFVTPKGAARVGDTWQVLVGTAVYASEDGESWRRSTDLISRGVSAATSPEGLCSVPGGSEALIIGYEKSDDFSTSRPIAWSGSDTTWRTVSVTNAPFGELTRCVTDGSSIMIEGTVADSADESGELAMWTSTDGRTWTEMDIPQDAEILDPVAVDGGYAAVGAYEGDPVIWFSDGTTWQWAPAPGDLKHGQILAFGPDLLLASDFGSPSMTLLPGVAERIGQL